MLDRRRSRLGQASAALRLLYLEEEADLARLVAITSWRKAVIFVMFCGNSYDDNMREGASLKPSELLSRGERLEWDPCVGETEE